MQGASDLQKRVQNLNDQISDIFHATKLNLSALAVQLESFNQSKVTSSTLNRCRDEFSNIQNLFEERGKLRLEYLITQQIREEEAKVRRERLVEYEEKIYDQRRLIADKEAFYDGLLKPRRRKPAHMTVEEFHSMRRQEIVTEERRNIKRLEEETYELKLMQKVLKKDNDGLESYLQVIDSEQLTEEQLQSIEDALSKNPMMYDSIKDLPSRREELGEILKVSQRIKSIDDASDEMYKQYRQQKELYQYLKWQHDKLKAQYRQKNGQKYEQELRMKKRFDHKGKYQLRRSFSI